MKHFFLVINSILALFILSFAVVFAAQYYQVGNTATVTVNEWSACNTVTNNCGPAIFVPTNSSAEWSNFRTNKPVCIALGSCVSSGDCTARASLNCDCSGVENYDSSYWGNWTYSNIVATANGATNLTWGGDDYLYCSNGTYYEYYYGSSVQCN